MSVVPCYARNAPLYPETLRRTKSTNEIMMNNRPLFALQRRTHNRSYLRSIVRNTSLITALYMKPEMGITVESTPVWGIPVPSPP